MKFKKNIFIYILISCVIILGLYFVSNFNQIKVYEFIGGDETFTVKGNATFNKQINLLNITDIIANVPYDTKVKSISFSMSAYCKNEKRLIFANRIGDIDASEAYNLGEILAKTKYSIREKYGYEEYFNDEIINNFAKIVYFEIEYTDENDETHQYQISLEVEKQTNNKFFYFKSNHI